MSSTIAMLLPIFLVAGIGLWLTLMTRTAQRTGKGLLAFSDPRLPLQAESSTLAVDAHSVRIEYVPLRHQGRATYPPSLRLRLERPFGSAVFLSRERAGDRFLKNVGLSQESETGDRELDDLFHIVAESPHQARTWLTSSNARERLLAIGRRAGFEYLEITESHEEIYFYNFRLASEKTFIEETQSLAADVVSLAEEARTTLGEVAIGQKPFSWRFRLYRSTGPRVFINIVTICAILGFVILNRLGRHLFYELDAIALSSVAVLAAFVIVLAITRPAIRGLQLPSKVFFTFLMGVMSLALLLGTGLGIYLNAAWDKEVHSRELIKIDRKWITSGRSGRSYRVRLQFERPPILPFSGPSALYVDSQTYARISPGRTRAILNTHPGFFHFPWYEMVGFDEREN